MEKRKVGFRVLKQRVLRFHGQYENREWDYFSLGAHAHADHDSRKIRGRGSLRSTHEGNGVLTWSWGGSTPSLLTLGVLTASHI